LEATKIINTSTNKLCAYYNTVRCTMVGQGRGTTFQKVGYGTRRTWADIDITSKGF